MQNMEKNVNFKAHSNAFMFTSEPIFHWKLMLDLQIDENELTLFPTEIKYLITLQHLSIANNEIQVTIIFIKKGKSLSMVRILTSCKFYTVVGNTA